MYPVSIDFQNKIKENTRTFKCSVQIQHSTGTLTLDDKDVVANTMKFAEGTQGQEDFNLGGTVASTFEFTIYKLAEYADIEFEGATVLPQIGLLTKNTTL